ncbi:Nardilysin [Blattella germanica]|nr:Nardilysin [Blattella germanica]
MFFVKSKHLQYNSFIFRRLFEPYFQRTVKQDFRESKISNQNNMNETIPDVRESSVKSIQYLPTPTKSQNDKKEYSAEEESSISASTPTSNKGNSDDSEDESHSHETSALGLCVGVGSFSDPWDIQGMAHFLEHMVFMGSEKFPKENDFDAFIKKRGGSDNAQTDCETTTFYFECQDKDLKEAIDKFSQFFVSPLMRREGMTREREAIESEFQMSVTSDETRREQLLCSLANPENPTRKFTWGNLITLRDNVTDDNLYKAVHEFRNKHYSAHRMTLAVQSRLPLETLEPWIQEFFSAVPVNEIPPDDFKKYSTSVFNASEFNKIYWVKSVKDLCEVELTWALPPLRHMYHTKPEAYYGLLVFLQDVMMMDCQIIPCLHCFASVLYLLVMGSNICRSFFSELQTIQETKFRFAEEVPPDENVETLATNMQFYPPEDYITGPELIFRYDPEAIQRILDALKPDTVNIMVSCQDHGKELDRKEPWFQTEYSVSDIPNDWLELWQKIEPNPSFRMPDPNIFLTTNFDLLPFSEEDDELTMPYPVKVLQNEAYEIWYRRDFNAALTDLYVGILNQMLVEELYPAHAADLECLITAADKGIVLKFKGYNEKLHLLLEAVVNNAVDKHTSLSKVDLTTLINFAKEFVKSFYIQGLFQGNLTDEQAIEACNKVKEILMFEPLSPVKFPEIRVLEVPLGEQCCRVNSFNTEDTNSTVTNYYQSGLFNLKNYCIVELIVMLMEEPVFDILRTKEQLGTEHVDNRIEVFLKKFSKTMKKMKDKELSIVRSSLIRLKKLSDIHLKEEVNRNWEEIASREYMFDRLKKEVAYLENIKLSEIRKWYHNHVLCGNKKNFRKLSVQVVGKPVSNPSVEFSLQFIVQKEKQTKNSKKFITDINNYKRDLPMYPPVELNRRKTIRD